MGGCKLKCVESGMVAQLGKLYALISFGLVMALFSFLFGLLYFAFV